MIHFFLKFMINKGGTFFCILFVLVSVIVLVVSAPRFTAGIIGMSVGVVGLLVVLAGVLWYRRYRPKFPWRRAPAPSSVDNFSMNTRTSNAGSVESDRSN